MSKVLRDEKLFFILRGKKNSIPLSKGFGTGTKIYRHIKYLTADNAYQFILRIIDLEMKSSQNTLSGAGLIVLNKFHINSCCFVVIVVVGFHKIAAFISEYGRCNDF